MRICQIVDDFPPQKGGGTLLHNQSLVDYLQSKGHDVEVIVLRRNVKDILSFEKQSAESGYKIHNVYLKNTKFISALSWFFEIKKIIKKLEKKSKIDVFDVHNSIFIPLFFGRKANVILSLHFYELTCPVGVGRNINNAWPMPCGNFSLKKCISCVSPLNYFFWKLLRKYAIKKSTKILVKYRPMAESLTNNGINSSKIVLVPHWIDAQKINKQTTRSEHSTFNFGFLGRLANEKNPMLLLQAFEKLQNHYENVRLIFVGGGALESSLKEYCVKNNISSKVKITGLLHHDDIYTELKNIDSFVFTSPYDNYGWALLEAMATSRPIIATNVYGIKDILNNTKNALLTEQTPDSISEKMEHLLKNPVLGKIIGLNAYQTVKSRHSLKNLEKYEELLEQFKQSH